MTKVLDIASTVRSVLSDPDVDIYSNSLVYDAIYNAEIVIASNRFDSTAVYEQFICSAGTRQELTDSQSIIAVDKNSESKRSIRLVSKNDLDSFTPQWHSQTSTDAEEYAVDIRQPLAFYLSPPVVGGHVIDIVHSSIPTGYGVVDENTETTVKDNFTQAIIEFALYICFSSDTEGTPNISRAQQHLSLFSNMLGLNWQTIKSQSAKYPENKR